jgi:hypothetical protein
VITPDSPDRQYSTRLRTALVMIGSGTAGAYHAGVLRALHEAGIKIDLVAGAGIGAVGALFAAIDGGARLWDADGMWKGDGVSRWYGWRPPLGFAGWAIAVAAAIFCVPLILLAVAVLTGIAGLLLTLVGLEGAGRALTIGFSAWVARLFDPSALPTVIPRLVLFSLVVAVAGLSITLVRDAIAGGATRRTRRDLAWRLVGAPLSTAAVFQRATVELWSLIRGAAPLAAPAPRELGRAYVELLVDNLGQPGIRELLLTTHDLDARRDLVFALLGEPHRPRFFSRTAGGDRSARPCEAFDLAGVGRDHAMDALAGALAVPLATAPHLVTFAAEGAWCGETHRTCDRPGALPRVLEEVAAAGVEQVVVVSAAPPAGRPHQLSSGRADLRGRAGEQIAAFETAGLRDAIELFAGRFSGLFVVRPVHNAVGPMDVRGVYDERSDRRYTVAELVDRGYEDAYRQFIDPIVGASGEAIPSVHPSNGRIRRAPPVQS